MAFFIGCLVGAGIVLTVIGLTFLVRFNAYHKGYLDGLNYGRDVETKIIQWDFEDDGK